MTRERNEFEKYLRQFDYTLPRELVALAPAQPRDAARLLVHDRGSNEIKFDRFQNLAKYLPRGAVLVFNQTKVVPARLEVIKSSGGRARILLLERKGKLITVLADRKLVVGSTVRVGSHEFVVLSRQAEQYRLQFKFSVTDFERLITRHGVTPLPPYLKASRLSEAKRKKLYQSVFAKDLGSAAAPTASLHFTKRLVRSLREHGFGIEFVTLHVGLGTFAPLTERNMRQRRLHAEPYAIDPATARRLSAAKRAGRPIVAVGTTSLRALETAARGKRLTKLRGTTQLFIRPGDPINFVDGLITNFHVPRSSLLMLVAALVGRKKVLQLYRVAIKKRMKFFSFGDGMLIK